MFRFYIHCFSHSLPMWCVLSWLLYHHFCQTYFEIHSKGNRASCSKDHSSLSCQLMLCCIYSLPKMVETTMTLLLALLHREFGSLCKCLSDQLWASWVYISSHIWEARNRNFEREINFAACVGPAYIFL